MSERLHAEWWSGPSGTGRPVVLLHGFTQNTRSWGPFGEALAGARPVLAVDLPGHGGSEPVRAGLERTADLVAELIVECSTPPTVIGYSMGGRVALHLALRHPDAAARLVLVSTTAGIDDDEERTARRLADERLADRIDTIGTDDFLDEWLAQPLFASLPAGATCRDARRANTADGLSSSLRLTGTGMQQPLWDRIGSIDIPTLVLVGALDAKFVAIGERLVSTIGANARLGVIAEAGHNAPLERPDATTDAILDAID